MELICLCASHIDSAIRLQHFEDMLESWSLQHIRVPMIVSISVEPELEDLLYQTSEKIDNKYNGVMLSDNDEDADYNEDSNKTWLHIIVGSKTNQFNHYKRAVSKLNTLLNEDSDDYDTVSKDIWLMFTDDDDLWNEQRTYLFTNGLSNLEDIDGDMIYVKVNGSFTSMISEKSPRIISDVNELEIDKINVHRGLYTDYSCRLRDFVRYLSISKESVLESKFSDRFLIKFLQHGCRGINITPDTWSYYFRIWDGQLRLSRDGIIDKYRGIFRSDTPESIIDRFLLEIQVYASCITTMSFQDIQDPYELFVKYFFKDIPDDLEYAFHDVIRQEGPVLDMINSPLMTYNNNDDDDDDDDDVDDLTLDLYE